MEDQLYKQNPLEKFFIYTIYQNYTLALKLKVDLCSGRANSLHMLLLRSCPSVADHCKPINDISVKVGIQQYPSISLIHSA